MDRKTTIRGVGGLALAVAAGLASFSANAQEEGGFFSDVGITFSGFVRYDSAFRMTQDENPNNIAGNLFNGVNQPRSAGDPATGYNVTSLQIPHTRMQETANSKFNVNQFRGKFDTAINFSPNVQLYSSLRAIFDVGDYDNYNPNGIGSTSEGFNQQKPEFFEYDDYNSGGCLNPVEICGRRYMVDFTALYLDYTFGSVLVRVGQQQIAWGQALFFRVFDVPNGLDLRRHLILDDALEEYADERVASPGIRITSQFAQQWEADAYVQAFVPTTYPTPNTPFNVIPAQFTIHETYSDKHEWEDFNYGLRIRGNFGQWGVQFIATQRWNHEGVFRWTESGANTDVPGIPGSGLIVARTPLEVDPSGVTSANEWFTYAGRVRLDGLEGLNALITEFNDADSLLSGLGLQAISDLSATLGIDLTTAGVGPTGALGAMPVTTVDAAARELDLFFTLTGGLRGHLAHEYFQEEVYGAGVSYVVEASPGSILDQLIINFETSFIPDRVFTAPSLSRNYIVEDESVSALVMEKYHRWFGDFPATYMVFQAIHKTESNLFGQHLGCQGGTGGGPGTVAGAENPNTRQCTPQSGGSTDVVLAFLQPFPNYIYRLSGAALLDVDGGLFVQAGFRWSPGNNLTFDIFYNHVEGNLYGDPNSNALQNIDFTDEVAIRAALQF